MTTGELTVPAFTENVAEVEPFEILTDEGTLSTAPLDVDNDTAMLPLLAGTVKVTDPVPD